MLHPCSLWLPTEVYLPVHKIRLILSKWPVWRTTCRLTIEVDKSIPPQPVESWKCNNDASHRRGGMFFEYLFLSSWHSSCFNAPVRDEQSILSLPLSCWFQANENHCHHLTIKDKWLVFIKWRTCEIRPSASSFIHQGSDHSRPFIIY